MSNLKLCTEALENGDWGGKDFLTVPRSSLTPTHFSTRLLIGCSPSSYHILGIVLHLSVCVLSERIHDHECRLVQIAEHL